MKFSYNFIRFIHNLLTLYRATWISLKRYKIVEEIETFEKIETIKDIYINVVKGVKDEFEYELVGPLNGLEGNVRFSMQLSRKNIAFYRSISNKSDVYMVNKSTIAMESAVYIVRCAFLSKPLNIAQKKLIGLHFRSLEKRIQWNYPSSGNHMLHELCALGIASQWYEKDKEYIRVINELLEKEILSQLNVYGHFEHSANYSLQVYETVLFYLETYGKNIISCYIKCVVWKTFLDNIDWLLLNRRSYGNTDDSSILYPGLSKLGNFEYRSILKEYIPRWFDDGDFNYPDYSLKLDDIELVFRFNELSRIESKRLFTHNVPGISLHIFKGTEEITQSPNFLYGVLSPAEKRLVSAINNVCVHHQINYLSDFEISCNVVTRIKNISRKGTSIIIEMDIADFNYILNLSWSANEIVITSNIAMISSCWYIEEGANLHFSGNNVQTVYRNGLEKGLRTENHLRISNELVNNLKIEW